MFVRVLVGNTLGKISLSAVRYGIALSFGEPSMQNCTQMEVNRVRLWWLQLELVKEKPALKASEKNTRRETSSAF